MITGPAIAIAISTFDRVEGLLLLLDAIDRQNLGSWADQVVSIIVVDNSPRASAREPLVGRPHRFGYTYVHEARRGLSFARNAALKSASALGATHVVFVDDDEMPAPVWLAALYARLDETQAAAAIGLVHPIFTAPPPGWAIRGGFFAKTLREQGGLLSDGYTSNAMVDLTAVRRLGLSFDTRFNATGGEDTMFFHNLRRGGGRIVLASAAVVYELIPARRATVAWLARRWFRTGATEANLGVRNPRSGIGRLHGCVRGAVRILAAVGRIALALPRARRHPETLVRAIYTLSRGAGLVAYAFGRDYAEYADRSYR